MYYIYRINYVNVYGVNDMIKLYRLNDLYRVNSQSCRWYLN